jgi:hypothetical protein
MTIASIATDARLPEHTGCPEHAWDVESSHRTSIGTVLYTRCVRCGNRRVELQENRSMVPPIVQSKVVQSKVVQGKEI